MENSTIIKLEYLEPLGLEDAQINVEAPTTIKVEYIETEHGSDNNDCKFT